MNQITPLSGLLSTPDAKPAPSTIAENTFANMLKDTVSEVSNQQHIADDAVRQLHTGGPKNIHDVMIAMEQADISVRMLVQMRNKVMEAYQEVMRMQL